MHEESILIFKNFDRHGKMFHEKLIEDNFRHALELFSPNSVILTLSNQWSGFYMIDTYPMKQPKHFRLITARKVSQYGVFTGPYFPVFGLKTENVPYSVRIFSVFSPNTGKYGPQKTPYLDTFHAVNVASL